MDNINFNRIINNVNIINLFPQVEDSNMKSPTVTFKYSPTIKSKINNYRQAVSYGVTPTHCECNMVDDQYKVGEHVFTGNLNIIQNIELRTLMKKGLNYREIPTGNKSTVYKAVTDSLDLYIHKISERCKIPLDNFIPWKTEFLQKVKHKLDKLTVIVIMCYLNNVTEMNFNIFRINGFLSPPTKQPTILL